MPFSGSLLIASKYVSIGVVLIAVGMWALLFTGYCFGQRRYLSEQEFKLIALQAEGSLIAGFDLGSGGAAKYLAEHPDCCRIEGGTFFRDSSFVARLFGLKTTWVRVIYEVTNEFYQASRADGRFYEAYVGVSRCGKVSEKIGVRISKSM